MGQKLIGVYLRSMPYVHDNNHDTGVDNVGNDSVIADSPSP